MSLDGFIARVDGSVDFLKPYENSGEDYGYKKFYNSVGTIIIGNTTYEQFKEAYTGKDCYVFSRKKNKNKEVNITYVNEDVKEFLKKLKLKDNKNIWIVGGADIVNQFLKYNLIDKFMIFIVPIFLGNGIPLFKSINSENQLKLLKVKTYDLGMVELNYERKS